MAEKTADGIKFKKVRSYSKSATSDVVEKVNQSTTASVAEGKSVGSGDGAKPAIEKNTLESVTSVLAVLSIHGELPKDNSGVAALTIRQLLRKFVPGLNPLLVEYICAFGAHGIAVLMRYIRNNVENEKQKEELAQEVVEKYDKFKEEI